MPRKAGWSEELEARKRRVSSTLQTEGWKQDIEPYLRERMEEATIRLMEKREPNIKTLQNERAIYKAHKGLLDQVEAWSK